MQEGLTKNRGAVVVTGASSGIGEACALRLDRRGFQVFAGVRSAKDQKSLKSKGVGPVTPILLDVTDDARSEEHTSELQSRPHLVCRLLLEKKKKKSITMKRTRSTIKQRTSRCHSKTIWKK